MQNRNKQPQVALHEKIRLLRPDAKFTVRNKKDSALDKNSVIIGDYSVDWREENAEPLPSLAEIEAVTDKQVNAKEAQDIKAARNRTAWQDLAMRGVFVIEKRLNPTLRFSDYLDTLKAMAQD
jgi:hypothetical protein